jgi:hypothetical protein
MRRAVEKPAMEDKNCGTNVSCTLYVAPRLQVGALRAVAAASLSRRSLRLWVMVLRIMHTDWTLASLHDDRRRYSRYSPLSPCRDEVRLAV